MWLIIACNGEQKPSYEEPEGEEQIADPTIDNVSDAIDADPYDPSLYFLRANLYYDEGSFELALKDMQSAVLLDSTVVDYYIVLSQLFIETGNAEKAIKSMQKAIAINPGDVTSYLLAGKYAYIVKEYQAAVDFLNQALQLEVTNPDAYFLKGAVYRDMGDTTKAISNFQTCVEQDPTYDEAYLQIGLLYAASGNDRAMDYFTNTIKSNPDNLFAYKGLGKYFKQRGEFTKAIEQFKQIILRDMDAPETLVQIGDCYMAMDSIQKAYMHYDMAVGTDPVYVEAYHKRGLAAMLQYDLKNARFNFEQALSLDEEYEPSIKALEELEKLEAQS
jgi:tetratricopeptide (TPR) repeat protein